jgi:membrane dipeptidase
LCTAAQAQQPIDPKVQARIDRILRQTPLIDGHNDIAEQLQESHGSASPPSMAPTNGLTIR